MEYLTANVPGVERAIISVHCHDDLGMATANTLAAVRAGARQVEVTMNGIGERAGNTSLEEVVMALATRGDQFGGGTTRIRKERLVPASRLVSTLTGVPVQPNKAIVGANAFAHEAGIHQDGMLKERTTYEIMDPTDVGWEGTRLVLGKHSGQGRVPQYPAGDRHSTGRGPTQRGVPAIPGVGRPQEGRHRRGPGGARERPARSG